MKIHFRLGWAKAGKIQPKSFKSSAAYELFAVYTQRISKFALCEAAGFDITQYSKATGVKLWVCERGKGTKPLSSEELAKQLNRELGSGAKEIQILIGGPNGFTDDDFDTMKPDLRWSFGPMTLPHELAAVIASEQLYRAFSILNRLPYHLEH